LRGAVARGERLRAHDALGPEHRATLQKRRIGDELIAHVPPALAGERALLKLLLELPDTLSP